MGSSNWRGRGGNPIAEFVEAATAANGDTRVVADPQAAASARRLDDQLNPAGNPRVKPDAVRGLARPLGAARVDGVRRKFEGDCLELEHQRLNRMRYRRCSDTDFCGRADPVLTEHPKVLESCGGSGDAGLVQSVLDGVLGLDQHRVLLVSTWTVKQTSRTSSGTSRSKGPDSGFRTMESPSRGIRNLDLESSLVNAIHSRRNAPGATSARLSAARLSTAPKECGGKVVAPAVVLRASPGGS